VRSQINLGRDNETGKEVGSVYIWSMRADPIVVQRWRELRQMLILQLDMFDRGRLSLKSDGIDVSADAIENLKREIFEFDTLISDDEAKEAAGF